MKKKPQKEKITLENLADMMQSGFKEIRGDINSIRGNLVAHDQKFEELIESINKLPTREEVQSMIDRTYDIAVLKAEHERIKVIIRENLHVEI